MMNNNLRGSVAIVGVGQAGIGEAHGRTDMEIMVEAAQKAVSDAGLSMRDIDGIATASVGASMWALPTVEYLGIRPKFIDSTMLGGCSFVSHMLPAMMALNAGLCDNVLVCYGANARTSPTMTFAQQESRRAQFDPHPYETPYQSNIVTSYALAAARHMHQYGTTRRDLAEVAVAARKWAQLNPEAFMRDPLTIEEVLAARLIADPLSLRDCCMVSDGAGAYVLTRADRAKHLKQKPVYVLGNASAVWHRQISSMPDLTVTAAQESGERAFAMAGMQPSDIDVVELYDAFTINTILFLEDLGFCKKGEGGAFVANGGIAPGGRLPVNTNGGGLSCVHPGMYGMFITIEAVRQLRGEGGARQVAGAETAVVHGNGGLLSAQATAILGTEAAL
ncbi:thiolase [Noviherbaspirillum sedimenti]|uniref:Thiolase n=1 Tax=Noviherbaspirillum sedimenti TaxID=2320865 RepID=A0A3A3G830_9BURK|nr:thiolase [Noviherbaspirillum sedimenti]RJG02909.1 thiolase [Noviherbaspirillum sedimenti]